MPEVKLPVHDEFEVFLDEAEFVLDKVEAVEEDR